MTNQNMKNSIIKAQSIKILRGTIGLLEDIVERLETEPVSVPPPTAAPSETIPESTTVSELTTATPELVSKPVSDTPTVAPKALSEQPRAKTKLVDWLFPPFGTVQRFWDGILTKVRFVLPAAWNQQLSDWGLTGAIATLIVVILLTTVALLPKTPTQIAKEVPPETSETIETPPELAAPEPPEPIPSVPAPEAPEAPPPAETPTPPQLELTPEQSLIAAIENQVAEITDQYANGLIQSIQANFEGSRLIVIVTDSWDELNSQRQNQLADEIWHRAEELDFSKLEVTNSQGTLVARSPVVGNHMVVLQGKLSVIGQK